MERREGRGKVCRVAYGGEGGQVLQGPSAVLAS